MRRFLLFIFFVIFHFYFVFGQNLNETSHVNYSELINNSISPLIPLTSQVSIDTAFISQPILCYGGTGNIQINVSQTTIPSQYSCVVGYYANSSFFVSYYSTNLTTANQLFLNNGGFTANIDYFIRIVDSTAYYTANSFGSGTSNIGIYDEFSFINFSEPSELLATTTTIDVSNCFIDDGEISVNISGGTPFLIGDPYIILWNPGGGTTDNITNLSSGTYNCLVTDSNGCSISVSSIVNAPVNGCTDQTACNYDSTAVCDDGSCVLPDGCTDILACNFNYTAVCDDGSCVYPTSSTSIDTACNSYSWNGSTYTQSGIYSYVISLNNSTSSTTINPVSTLSYCSSNPNLNISAGYSIIEDVQLVGDNFNIDNSTSGINDFYEDYTATMYADITEGQTYTVEVITNDSSSASGTYAPEAINVYIDFNIDGDFDDLGEDLGEISIPYGTWISGTVYSFNVTVPSTGVYGATRMRVVTMSNAGGGVTMGPFVSLQRALIHPGLERRKIIQLF